MTVKITIDGRPLRVPEGLPVRKAALKNGIYIPGLCGHPDLPPAREVKWSECVYRGEEIIVAQFGENVAGDAGNCNLCLIAIQGENELVRACQTKATEGLVVRTHGDDITRARGEALAKILAHHPHACLTCAQREGCSLTQCSSNVPENERCCILLNRCELGKVVDYIGLPDGTPKYVHEKFPIIASDPFFDRDYNLCIGCLRCVRVCRDVRGVDALAATFKDSRIWVGTVQKGSLSESYCRYCGACVEVCPTGSLRDKSDSKPVRRGELAPCVEACPAGIDVPAYVRRIAIGDYSGALRVVYDRVPFPGILGYVCFHPCEGTCKHSVLGEGLAICALKRFVYENASREKIVLPKKAASTGKKIAVVGSGPAGLTAAYYLARAGHEVEVFEADAKPGGMLRHAIPQYRLPEAVLDDELQSLHHLGVRFKTQMRLGRDLQLNALIGAGYDAVLLAVGTSNFRKLNIPGEDIPGIMQALDLLRAIRNGQTQAFSGSVVVIGGGNVAVDTAMTVRRLGAENVTMVCLESQGEIPAHGWELEQAITEGIEIKNGWGPAQFLTENGGLKGIRFKRCTRVFDENGHFNPRYDESDTFEMDAGQVIIAVGQQVNREHLENETRLKAGQGGTFVVDRETFATEISGVYAAGDAVSGPGSVIEAIASGRKVANSIDQALGGNGIESQPKPDEIRDHPYLGRDEDFLRRQMPHPAHLDPELRIKGFEVIERGLTPEDAQNVALQCLRCNLRATITPVTLPPDKWQPLAFEKVQNLPSVEGVYQIADANKKVTKIVGTADIRAALEEECGKQAEGALFCWEEDRMYSKRESELIQLHLQQYGEMPGGGADDLDDLF